MDAEANRALALAVSKDLEARGIRVLRSETPAPGQHPHSTQMNSLLFLLGLFGFIAFILASALCASVIASLMARQRRETGVLRAVGASGGRIFSGYIAMAISISAISLALSLPASRLLSIVYARYTADILNFTIASTRIGFEPYAVQVILGFAVPALATALPLAFQSRLSVRECLSDSGAPSGKALPFGAGPGSLPLRNAARKPVRLAFAAMAIGLGMALFMAAGSIRSSIRWTIDSMAEAQSFDIALWLSASVPQAEMQAALSGLDGLARSAPAVRVTGVLEYGDGSQSGRSFNVNVLPPGQDLFSVKLTKGSWLDAARPDALVVNNLLMDREGLKLGQKIRVKAGDREFEGTVEGAIRETIGAPAVYACLLPGQATNAAFIRMEEGADVASACSDLEALLPRAGLAIERLSPMAEMKKAIEEHMVLITVFLSAVSLAVFLVGLAAIASALGLSVLERTREIGVLRAIGASPGRIAALIGLEGAAMGGIGYLFAFLLSLPLSLAASSVFGLIMFESPLAFKPDIGLAALVLPFALASGLLAALAPGLSAARRNVAANLRYE
jgi:putative ABC transport system permease protein